MVRHRQVGVTEQQRKAYERWVVGGGKRYLTDNQKRCLKYDLRKVIEKEIEDLIWFFDVSGGLKGSPVEISLPKRRTRFSSLSVDLAATLDMISVIEEWQSSLERLKEAIAADPQRYIRA